MEIALSRSADKFVPKNRWIASLSNGETIFEDARRGAQPTWVRLKEYLEENGLSITQLRVQIGGLEVKLPKNQEGYIQKKKIWSTGATSGACICVGYAQGGLAMIHELGADKSSRTKYCKDPGEPWTIYRADIRKNRNE